MSKALAVSFYGVQRDGMLFRVYSETPKSFIGSFPWGHGDSWSAPGRRMNPKFVLRLQSFEAARDAAKAINDARAAHSKAEQELNRANAQELTDLIAKLAAKGG